jgi:hypothetical protein
MEEVWKDIKGFEGLYQVSNMGRVRSLDRDVVFTYKGKVRINHYKGKIMKLINDGRGYFQVNLGKRHYKVHRLVAIHFIDGYQPNLVINHLNEIRTDNRAENLQFCTRGSNVLYSFNIHGSNKLGRQVKQFDGKGRCLSVYRTAMDAARILGLDYGRFIESLKKNKCQRKGYIFQYCDDLVDFIEESNTDVVSVFKRRKRQ